MFRLAVITCLAAVCLWAQSGPETSGSSDAAWQRAVQLHQAGDLPAAIEAYLACLRIDPSRFDARSNLGAALAASGRYPEAIEQYRQALASAPPEFAGRLRQNLGLAFYKSGRYGEAAAELASVRQDQGADLKNDLLLADSYLQNGDPAKAAALLSPYETSNPGDKAVAYVLGTALIRSGDIAHGQRVIDLILRDGDSAEARFLLGVTSFAAKDFPGAVKQFASALALKADIPGLHSFYGQALLNTGDANAAADAFRQELARNPNDFDSNLRLGEILLERKAFPDALPLLQKAAQERTQSFPAAMAVARAELGQHEYGHAIPQLRDVIARWPESAAAHALLADADSAAGNTADAAGERKLAARLHSADDPDKDGGPKPGDLAPDFTLPGLRASGDSPGAPTSLKQLRSHANGARPVVLLFGSYTCPNFREQAPAINAVAEKYGKLVPFLLVYIREAHTGDTWESTINQREGIDWQPARTMAEMQQHANSCVRKLKMSFPAVVDGMDGKVEQAYAAWPSRLYVIGKDGRVRYRTLLTEFDFHPDELEAAIAKVSREK
jgi:tetratricopeptide (TPR) repeat protein